MVALAGLWLATLGPGLVGWVLIVLGWVAAAWVASWARARRRKLHVERHRPPVGVDCGDLVAAPSEHERPEPEAARNVRTRLYEMLSVPQSDASLNELLKDVHSLRFRAATTVNHAAASRALGVMAPRPWRPEQVFLE